ncbi:MAG TPA: hypothetical protein VGO18_21015 [Steroidobacteraceae bacterium]|jgi:hypothetical protein|nr:hypothetical protein [Steroidobacteraceae bacterium]
MTRVAKAHGFLEQSRLKLDWADKYLKELEDHSKALNNDEVERVFFAAQALIGAIHDHLVSAANCAGRGLWAEEMTELRMSDPLLKYFWLARNVELHGNVVRWKFGANEVVMKLVDEAKLKDFIGYRPSHGLDFGKHHTARMIHHLFWADGHRSFVRDPRPIAGRAEKIGYSVAFSSSSLELMSFVTPDYKSKGRAVKGGTVDAPQTHLGCPIATSVSSALWWAINFYREKANDLDVKLSP